jgi:hypothetical protein
MDRGPKTGMVMQQVRCRDILVSKEMPLREKTGGLGIAGMTPNGTDSS